MHQPLYSRNIFEFIKLLINDQGNLYINREDELVAGALLTTEGNIILIRKMRIKQFKNISIFV